MTNVGQTIRTTLGVSAQVRKLVPKTAVIIRDLYIVTTDQEVWDALKTFVGGAKIPVEEFKVTLSRLKSREQRLAIVEMEQESSHTLRKKTRIKIAYVNCRFRDRLCVPRCFKSSGYGHQTRACKDADRTKGCHRYGEQTTRARTAEP